MKGLWSVLLLVLLSAGCGNPDQPREIRETRTLAPVASSQAAPPAARESSPAEMQALSGHPTPESGYAWDLPAGWKELAPTPIRTGNFAVEASPEIECYLTVIPGAGGGVPANINRWRAQMGQPPLEEPDIAGLPVLEVLGASAALVEIDGEFTGMTGSKRPGYRIRGILCPLPSETVFVKMTGPAAEVAAEKGRFLEFCASLRKGESPAHAPAEEDQ